MALVGISLGLIGSGGSILTVPILVYVMGIDPLVATSYSLFIVGSTSMAGAGIQYRKGLVRISTALLFGLSSVTVVFFTRKWLLPVIPRELLHIGNWVITQGMATMILFALLMIAAATAMIKARPVTKHTGVIAASANLNMLWYGVLIGLVTGLLGAGGGFLIVPALVLLLHIPMKEAVGTSLLIIGLNSLIGFTGDTGHHNIDWGLLIVVTLISIAGIAVGLLLSKKINGNQLKKAFGWFVLAMGTYIIIRELLLNHTM